MLRSRQGGKRAIALIRRGIASSKHGSKQTKGPGTAGYVRHQPKVEAPSEAPAPAMPRPAPPQPPQQQGPSSGGSSSSSWQLHPAVPVDVRLLGAGLAGAGALAFALSGDGGGPAPPKPRGEDAADAAPVISSDAHFLSAAPETTEPESAAAEKAPDEPTVEAPAEVPAPPEEAPAEEPAEPEIVVDIREVLGLIEEVLSKPAEALLDEAAAAVAAAEQAQQAATEAENKKKDAEEEEEPRRHVRAASADTQAAQVAITSAISDTAAESISSDLAKAPLGVSAMTPHRHPAPHKPAGEGEGKAEAPAPAVAEAARLLGVAPEALTATGLLAEAARGEEGAGGTWEEFTFRRRQAEADAAAVAALLSSAAEHVRGELEAARAAAEAACAEAAAARAAAAAQAERLRAAAAEAVARAERAAAEALALQAEKLANAHAEVTVRERVERQGRLDDLRLRLGALQRALDRRADAARGAAAAHRLAEGAFALQDALARGAPADVAAEALVAAAGRDELVAAALAAVPRGRRLPTPVQLADEYADVAGAARELAALPAGRGGMLAAAAAKAAASLKLREREPMASALPGGGGIDAALAAVEAALAAGRLGDAAARLECAAAGTAAAPAVAGWVAAARARAAAEQAAAVVEAHAATAALSLA